MPLRSLTLALAGTLLLAPAAAQAAQRSRQSVLVVRSLPAGAQVLLDGVPSGVTPRSFSGIGPGGHQVELRMAGRKPANRQVRVRRGERRVVHATLAPADRLAPRDRQRRGQAIAATARRWYEWTRAVQLGTMIPGVAGVQSLGTITVDPSTELFCQWTTAQDEEGNTVVNVQCFLDPEHTQPAGAVTATLAATSLGVRFDFTAGPVAGLDGDLSVRPDSGSGTRITGTGSFSDDSSWTLDYGVTLTGSGFSTAGTVDVTAPDGTTSHWELAGGLEGADWHVTSSDGTTLEMHSEPDGSGSGSLQVTATGEELASFTWTPEGVVTVTYPDGTTEEIPIQG